MEDHTDQRRPLQKIVGILFWIGRAILIIGALLFVGAYLAIGNSYVADYGDGVTFDGVDSLYSSMHFSTLNWYGSPLARRCPVVVHLGQQNLDENTFSSRNRMQAVGATIIPPGNGFGRAVLEQNGVVIDVTYDDQGRISWLQVYVKMHQDGTWARVPITVKGKTGVLPLKKAELFRVFGKPLSLRSGG